MDVREHAHTTQYTLAPDAPPPGLCHHPEGARPALSRWAFTLVRGDFPVIFYRKRLGRHVLNPSPVSDS